MLSGHAAASLTFHSVSSTSAPLAPACGTPASKARRQANARLGAGPCGIKASASVRLAYGYAQYGYAQWENFLISPNAPLAGLALLVISLRPYCYCVVTVSPGGRRPDKENATYVAFGGVQVRTYLPGRIAW
jgi:hypothetical protein